MKDASSGLYLVLSLMVFFAAVGALLNGGHPKYDIAWMALSFPAIIFFAIKCVKVYKANQHDQV